MGLIVIPNNSLPREIEKIKKEMSSDPTVRKHYGFADVIRKDYEQRHDTYSTFNKTKAMSKGGTMRHRMHVPTTLYYKMLEVTGDPRYWDDAKNWKNHPECMVSGDT